MNSSGAALIHPGSRFMAKVVVNPKVDLAARAGDVNLSAEMLKKLDLFQKLNKPPSFEKFPGSTRLRRYARGEVICRQGDAGASAFYILKTEEIVRWQTAAIAEGGNPQLAAELPRWQKRLAETSELPEPPAPEGSTLGPRRRVATALLTNDASPPPKARGWLAGWFGRGRSASPSTPQFIPNDGPADLQYATRQAPMHEGEVFGEMSCMTLAPRSATIVADTDCYLLEFTRNIFDQIQKDEGYRARIDEIYRRRVLDGHLRKLEILRDLSDQQLAAIQSRLSLQIADPGTVICDEGDVSDCVYIVRSGLVQVLTETNVALRADEVHNWPAFARALLAGEKKPATVQSEPSAVVSAAENKPAAAKASLPLDPMKPGKPAAPIGTPVQRIWQALPPAAQSAARELAREDSPPGTAQEHLLLALNELIKDREWLAAKEFVTLLDQHELLAPTRTFPKGPAGVQKGWSELEVRVGGRLLLSAIFPQHVAGRRMSGPPRIVNYLSRGDIFGEMGVLLDRPRNATCVAYDHPGDDPNRKPGRVELVRIGADVFRELLAQTPALRERVQMLAEQRGQQIHAVHEAPPWDLGGAVAHSADFQQQGLIQGQRLLLIDLDRCTRCGDCVRACIATHDDGYSRLFLDGPRFEHYLVPSACRQCLNPSCLIGCPVGSIERGGNGQIVIRDWCIGCNTCAKQCPYDSIQMHDLGLIPERVTDWRWSLANAVDNDAWQQPRYNDAAWQTHTAPIAWDLSMQLQVARLRSGGSHSHEHVKCDFDQELDQPMRLRLKFDVPKQWLQTARHFRLLATSKGSGLKLWLNGQPLPFEQDEKQKRKGEVELMLEGLRLKAGANLLSVRVEPPVAVGLPILDVRLDPVPESTDPERTEIKLVTEKPVVCDLCSSLPSAQPACVQECPHEAAFRVDARFQFPVA
jgi:CRP-like cAMP-binding protein/Fe-S-cluster-containing hydrogenase component 2